MTAPTPGLSAAAEADTVGTHAAFRQRPDLRLVHVRGEDRTTWLNGQITNDVRNMPAGGSVHALAINVRGKIMAELWVLDLGDHFALLCSESALSTLLESLERFIIMEDVVLEPDADARIVSVQGPRAQALANFLPDTSTRTFTCDELGLGGVFILTDARRLATLTQQLMELSGSETFVELSDAGFELARLRSGRPRFGVDFDERSYPQEAGLKSLLSFSKGCYLGQEVVCTLEHRGRLNRHLCALRAEGTPGEAEPGSALTTPGGDACGELTSAVHDPRTGDLLALGYVKHAHASVGASILSGDTRWVIRSIVGESA